MKSHLTSEKAPINKQTRQAELLNDTQTAHLTGSWEWEPETDQYFWTDSMFFLHGLTPYSDGYITIEAAHQMIYQDDFSVVESYWEDLHRTGLAEARFRIVTADGKAKQVYAQGKAIYNSAGRPIFRGSFQEEKTEVHHYLLDEIHKQDVRINILDRAEEIAQSGTWQINLTTYETFYSDNMFRIHGVQPRSINPHPDSFVRFIHPEDKEIVISTFEKSYHEKIPIHLEYRIIRHDEEDRYMKVVSSIIKNQKGEQLLTGTTHDITEKKWLELALEQSYDNLKIQNQLFQHAEQLGSTGTWQLNFQTLEVYYSDNVYTIHGVKPQSLLPSPDSFFAFIYPEDRERMAEINSKMIAGEDVPLTEYRIIRADGKCRSLRQITKFSVNASNEKLLMGVIQDITEHHSARTQLKEIDEKLLVQSEWFAQASKMASIGNWFWNLDTGVTNFSENLHLIYDVKRDALPSKIEGLLKFVHSEDREVFQDVIRRMRAEENVVDSEFRILVSAGHIRYLRNRNKVVESPDGHKIVIGTIQDITRETTLQLQLSERMSFAELLSDTIHDIIIITDTSNNLLACNKQGDKIHGFKKSEVLGKNIFQVFPQLKTSQMIEHIRNAYQGKTVAVKAAKSVLTKGYHDLLIRPLKNSDDQMIGVFMMLHDVSQQHQLEQQLKERVAFIEKLVESSVDRIMVLDNNLNYIIWNKNCEQYYGIRKQDIIGKNVLELFPMFKTDPVYQECKKVLTGETIHIPVKENDTHKYSESYLIPIKNEKDQVTGILWVMHDLTEIMQAREQLVISETRLKAAQKIAHLGSWEYNHATGTLSWSEEIFLMYGYEPDSFEPTVDFYITTSHPEHHTDIQKLFSVTAESHSFINRIYTMDGRVRHIQTIGQLISDGSDQPARVIGTMLDITEQKNLHEELKEKTRAIRNQYEQARQAELIRNVSTWQWNTTGDKVFWSENLFRILGHIPYSFEPSVEKFVSMVHPDDRKIVVEAMAAVQKMDSGVLPMIDYRIFDKNGKLKYLHTGGRVSTTGSGKYVTGTVNDVTENVSLRRQLSQNEQLVQRILEADRDAISVYDQDLQCIIWNRCSEEIHGKSKSEAIGKYLFDLIPQLNQEHINKTIQLIMKDDLLVDPERHTIQLQTMTIEISPVANPGNENAGLLLITRKL
ncbi:MAG TPA: PAS domain-containing protein [Flavitalea sp.]|nr:PAS domain-containing protein [Flavitalea sp.]